MPLSKQIVDSHKEIAGSRTKNRLTVQVSYAFQLIMDFYTTDFLVMMDYIEDISIICNPSNPSEIHLYQVKTKTADKQYSFNAVIKEEWYQKLYKNAQKYAGYVESASVVCNTEVVSNQNPVFPNAKTSLEEKKIQSNVQKIRKAIATDIGVKEEEVDLSKFYFVKTSLSTKGHKSEIEHEFEDFLLKKDSDLQVVTVKSIFKLIYEELDEKFGNEIDEDCTDIQEIFDQKGVNSERIKEIIACGLAVQIPTLEKLFSEFNIRRVSEKKQYTSRFLKIKTDMYSDMTSFIETKKCLMRIIEKVNESGVDDMPELLEAVYEIANSADDILIVYAEEYYLKLLIMILIYRYCYGGENN